MPMEEKDVCLGGSEADLATSSTSLLADEGETSPREDDATGGIFASRRTGDEGSAVMVEGELEMLVNAKHYAATARKDRV